MIEIKNDAGKVVSVKVERGDTLWAIAKKYLGSGTKYTQLATINKISSPYTIYVGQIIHLTSDGGSVTPSSDNSNKPKIEHFGLQSDKDNTLFASWSWDKDHTESYKVQWAYATGAGISFRSNPSTNTVDKDDPGAARQSTYSIPSNATKVSFRVKPVSEKKSKNNKDTSYWTADWSDEKIFVVSDELPPEVPSGLSVRIEGYKITMTLNGIDSKTEAVKFQIVQDHEKTIKTQQVKVQTGHASYTHTVSAGCEYKVRCCAIKGDLVSEWSEYVIPDGKTAPVTPSGITDLRATSETAVHIEWGKSPTAESYNIEYATKKEYFDSSDQTQSVNVTSSSGGEPPTAWDLYGLETGQEYFFRVRAVGENSQTSGWCEIASVVIGTDPAAPTTWSSTTTAIVGEGLSLYWIHNTEDGSSQVKAELELTVNGTTLAPAITIRNSTDDELKDKTSMCTVDTVNGYIRWTEDDGDKSEYLGTSFVEGSKLEWRVRTAGITGNYGDWSIKRTIDIYAPATLELSVTDAEAVEIDTIETFPFYIRALPGPSTQTPIGYYVSITSNEIYETVDNVGNVKTVNEGEEIYSKYFDTQYDLVVEMSANNIDLQGGVKYTVTCTVSMNSGLTAEDSTPFTVAWTDAKYLPNAEISIDEESLTASIMPYCEDRKLVYYKVAYENRKYIKTEEAIDAVYGSVIRGKRTETGELVYSGMTADGEELYYCTVEETNILEGVYLSVYRREFDGTFTEIASRLDGANHTTVIDPHPALDYARYRIVATDKETGAVSYYDPPGYPVEGTAVVIQWAEEWSSFDTTEAAALEQPPWSGSLLKLPYNIDVSDNNQPDISLIEYVGRKHPVTYYGTHLGEKATWSVEIVKSDKETLYGLRRLKNWMGDVYVREPSGSGYWANITVSFSQKHRELTIPVTLNIVRVEGGV